VMNWCPGNPPIGGYTDQHYVVKISAGADFPMFVTRRQFLSVDLIGTICGFDGILVPGRRPKRVTEPNPTSRPQEESMLSFSNSSQYHEQFPLWTSG
jgi:hypothetical protein